MKSVGLILNYKIGCPLVRSLFWHKGFALSGSFYRVCNVRSWWNFLRNIIRILWDQLQVHQEPPCPPRLQKETQRKGRVLIGFLMLDLDENFTKAWIPTPGPSLQKRHPFIWPILQVHQAPLCPLLRLHEETLTNGGVLKGFLMLDLDENFTKAS